MLCIKLTYLRLTSSCSSFNSLYWDFCSASLATLAPSVSKMVTFNSLYWDFCSASATLELIKDVTGVTFNSLYWDFCSASNPLSANTYLNTSYFQFPLLGFLLCILPCGLSFWMAKQTPFNSLYWDFCSASRFSLGLRRARQLCLSIPFIGIFALHPFPSFLLMLSRPPFFQFPLLGFLLCILVV